jgi:hypothetical protein
MARRHVDAMNVASESFAITDIPRDNIDTVLGPDHAPLRAIQNIVPMLQECVANKCMLFETSLAPWAVPVTNKPIPPGYHHFAGPMGGRVSVTTHATSPRRAATTLPR